jgi:small GTP-binding protein
MVKNPFKRDKHDEPPMLPPDDSEGAWLDDEDDDSAEYYEDQKVDENIIPSGFRLLHTLEGHTENISRIAWSSQGNLLASGSDRSILVWSIENPLGKAHVISEEINCYGITFNPVTNHIIAGLIDGGGNSSPGFLKIYTLTRGKEVFTRPFSNAVWDVAITPDAEKIVVALGDATLRIYDIVSDTILSVLKGHKGGVNTVKITPDGKKIVSAGDDDTVKIWDLENGQEIFSLGGHKSTIWSLAIHPNSQLSASASSDATIRIWDIHAGKLLNVLEGHTEFLSSISFSSDGRFFASKGENVRLWSTQSLENIAILQEFRSGDSTASIQFHPTEPNILATLGSTPEYGADTAIRIWELDYDVILANAPKRQSVHYTTAKIALVGDSGVGKTTLGYRIAEKKFQETKSTHGQQFWVVDELGTTRADGTECEAVLWDFAGQQDYRLTHALFLDDVDLALVLFDASNQEEPLKGVEYWLKQLSQRERESKKILVAARIDRGRPAITQTELETFCDQHDVGGLVYTSAQENTGISELVEQIKSSIDWEAMSTTVTTQTFKRIKEYVLALKADASRKRLLVSWDELRDRLEEHYTHDEEWTFTDAEMQTAVKHLTTHGYVTILRGRAGDETVLLAPDVLINLAASLVMEARGNPRGLGALEEEKALRGEYKLPELENLDDDETHILLDAAVALFIEKNLCLRDTEGAQNLLIFPSLINQKRPLVENFEQVEGTSFTVSGPVEHIYPMMVVRLGYTNLFKRNNQWQNQAQYETGNGGLCGFRQIAEREGEIELVLYYEKSLPGHTRDMFEGMFKMFLNQRDLNITEYRPVICPSCSQQQERATIMRRTKEGRDFVICENCGTRISLREVTEGAPITSAEKRVLVREDIHSRLRNAYETNLTYVKGLRRDAAETVSCFVSYSWDDDKHKRWVYQLATDLRNAGLDVVFDRWELIPGANPARFMERIAESNFITVVGTPGYSDRYKNRLDAGTGVAAEMDLINDRMIGTEAQKSSVMPLLRSGDKTASFPPFLRPRLYSDFKDDNFYFVGLFDLVLALFGIPFDDPSVFDLRQQMDDLARQVNVQ